MNIENRVLEIMREVFDLDEVTTQVSQKNCPKWDSLHHLMLASELEDAFDLDLDPEEIGQMTDFDKVVQLLNSKL